MLNLRPTEWCLTAAQPGLRVNVNFNFDFPFVQAKPSHSGTPVVTHTPSILPSPGEAARLLAQAEAQHKIAADAHVRMTSLQAAAADAEAHASSLTAAAQQVHEAELLKAKAAAIEADAKKGLTAAVAAADASGSPAPRFAAADMEDADTDAEADAAVVRPSRKPGHAEEGVRFPQVQAQASVAASASKPPADHTNSSSTVVSKRTKKSGGEAAPPSTGSGQPNQGHMRIIPAPPSAFDPVVEADVALAGERFAEADAGMEAGVDAEAESQADAESQVEGDADGAEAEGSVAAAAAAAAAPAASAGGALDDHRLAGLAAHVASLAGRKGAGDADARSSLRGRMDGQKVLGA